MSYHGVSFGGCFSFFGTFTCIHFPFNPWLDTTRAVCLTSIAHFFPGMAASRKHGFSSAR